MSRVQRRAAFLESAARMYNQLEDWYDQHPDATFGEIEAQARHYRLKLMGETIALMIKVGLKATSWRLLPVPSAVKP